ncbi:MAG TPA: hypothetical protein VGM32_00915 [Rhodopila sp.]
MTISTIDRIRLESMLGMLGSNHVGERDNAAKLVAQFLRKRGLTWSDLLARQVAGREATGGEVGGATGPRPRQAFHQPSPRAAYVRRVRTGTGDLLWRWSMVIGLAAVGSMSLMSLLQLNASAQRMVDAAGGGRCAVRSQAGGWPTCASAAGDATAATALAIPAKVAVAAGKPKPGPSFAQGVADRKVADSWHKLAPPGLCSGQLGPGQEDVKSACAKAEALLAQFDQHRRTDAEYRRGWNSIPL